MTELTSIGPEELAAAPTAPTWRDLIAEIEWLAIEFETAAGRIMDHLDSIEAEGDNVPEAVQKAVQEAVEEARCAVDDAVGEVVQHFKNIHTAADNADDADDEQPTT